MNLHDYQRAVRQLSLAREHEPANVQLPGFELYRHMIRARFEGMAQVAFRRTWALLGEAACAASFARYLERGPNSPILRDVIAAFAEFALQDHELRAPAPARELLRFEAAVWQVASAPMVLPARGSLRELDFDGVLVTNPTLQTLTLAHDVLPGASSEPRDPHTLLVYRREGDDDVHWYRAPDVLSELLTSCAGSEATLAEQLHGIMAQRAQQHGAPLDPSAAEQLLEELAGALSVAAERGVLLGVRDL